MELLSVSKTTAIHFLVIISVATTIFLTSLGKARLWDRDEPRNAGCAAEMLERGDWVVPIFNDELRHQKPVLLYWLMMASYSLLGVTEFAARLPSAVLAVGSVLLTYGIAKRLFDSSVALLAAIALSSCIMFGVAARAATPDSVLIFFSTLGIFFYINGTFAPNQGSGVMLRNDGHWFPQSWIHVVLMNLAFGLAVLAKGPVGLVVPTAIIGMFLLIQRLQPLSAADKNTEGKIFFWLRSVFRVLNPVHFLKTCWYMRPLTAIGFVALVAAPWYIAVGVATNGDFTNLFFLTENFARATTVMENHSGSWLYYPATIAIGFFPWSIFLGPILFTIDHQISRRTVHAAPITFLTCWVAVQIGLFSLAETKLPSYVTPCYPALAILTSFCVLKWLPNIAVMGRRWQYATLGTFVTAGLVTCVGLSIASSRYFPQIWWVAGLGLIPVIGGAVSIYLHYANRSHQAVWSTTTSAVLFCLFLFGAVTVAVDSTRQTHLVLNQVKSATDSRAVATYHCLESSWVFYAERPIYELFRGDQSEADKNSLDREDFWKRKPVISPEDFVQAKPNAMFITTDEHADELLGRLPSDYHVSREVDFFLKENQRLVLIESVAAETHTETASLQTELLPR